MSEREIKLRRRDFTRQFYRGNRLNLIVWLLAYVLLVGLNLSISWLIQQLVDISTGTPGPYSIGELAAICVCALIALVLFYTALYFVAPRFKARAMSQYKDFVFEQISRKSISAFTRENSALYLSALSNDAATIETDYLSPLPQIIRHIGSFLGAFAMMFWYSPQLTLASLAISALPVVVSILTGDRLAQKETEVSRRNDSLMATLKDSLSGFSVVKAFRAEGSVAGLVSASVRAAENAKASRNALSLLLECLGDVASSVAQFGVFLYGAYLAVSGKGVTPGIIMAFVQLMNYVLGPISVIPQYLAKRKAALALIDKLVVSLGENIREQGQPIAQELNRGIELQNLSFSYDGETPVLQDISATFESGKSYAIVGASGSGKSTLLSLLMAAHSGYTGSISYDGAELRDISTDSLYDLATLVQQNVFVFNAPLRDNITMFRDFPQADVDRAIVLSGLAELVESKGADYLCGENGSGLSGGEKQRLSIARSLLRSCPVLMMDEATAALDRETAFQVSNAILDLEDLTRIVVTHALEEKLLRRYDAILTLKNGRLQESGTFDELMARKGYFYSLFTVSQSDSP